MTGWVIYNLTTWQELGTIKSKNLWNCIWICLFCGQHHKRVLKCKSQGRVAKWITVPNLCRTCKEVAGFEPVSLLINIQIFFLICGILKTSTCTYGVHKFKYSSQKSFSFRSKTITSQMKMSNFFWLLYLNMYIITSLLLNKLTNGKSPPSKFCGYVWNVC